MDSETLSASLRRMCAAFDAWTEDPDWLTDANGNETAAWLELNAAYGEASTLCGYTPVEN